MIAKLDNPKTEHILVKQNKFFSNNEAPIISSVLGNSKLVSDFQQKANLSSNYFPSQCNAIKMVANYQTLVEKLKNTNLF